jgi:phosphoribosyl 1,2-cyclic phosphodiesterase
MTAGPAISVRFWGVRGSIATPGPESARYGGNTSCVEVRCGEHLLILDAGTGLRPLGVSLMARRRPVDAEILCSHTHFDHVCGLPFFAPAYHAGNKLRFWAGHLRPHFTIAEVVGTLLSAPLCPDLGQYMQATIEYRDFSCGEVLEPRHGLIVRTGALNHPGGATGYRIEWQGRSVAYVTDTEHRADRPDANVLALADQADVMIYDANYTEEDYPRHTGWGHSTWQEATRLADRARAGTLILFHHDPSRTDLMLDDIARQAHGRRPGTLVAREGMLIER